MTSNHHQSLKWLQINLQHIALATNSLTQLISELNLDVVLIQETYMALPWKSSQV